MMVEGDVDQKLADLLVAFDERLRGEATARGCLPPTTAAGDNDSAELQDLLDCVQILESRWPRNAMGDPPRLDREPRGEIVPPAPGIVKEKPIVRIGRFEVEHVLGEGGFGIVYLAQDPALHRHIALKVPRISSLAGTKTRERFRREAQAAATLDHPNIVPIYEAGEEGTICYIASAYCQGPNLAQWLKEQNSPVCPRLAAALIARLADATQYSHTRGVLHRDLKPSNVMLVPQTSPASSTGDGDLPFIPRLTDFGLAKLLDEDRDESAASAMFGTPSYMAPEQAGDSVGLVGSQTDVYALGVILYEMLVGRPPFQGANVIDVLDEVRNGEPVPPRRLRRDVPRDLEIICLKCLEQRPSRRYATACELSEEAK